MRWLTLAAVVAPPLVLAGIGVSHPHELSAASAPWWTNMHIILAAVFPLLAVGHWVLLRGIGGPLAWASRIAAFLYIGYYGALDALAGVGTGTLVQDGLSAGGGHHAPDGRDPAITSLFVVGNDLGYFGAYCFVAAGVLTAVVLYRGVGARAIPGGVVLVAASALFSQKHIYWPLGVISQLGLAAGFGLLAWALPVAREEAPVRQAVAVA
ncbi:hypothetical protein [Phytomonospora endophytica]|uniref:Uncharacterized protein n=1 Tax=Phytomonospora endophytica TaxID=714109 RepID=A0A841FIV3_9ACTN|nr:hypothetical protein [Phytomonospora endophytica]MBB6035804.1 hypothetical protein [Phytomonospora endophytica]GIG69525.1 hypothetical protein Pen01_58200 [Phytomonospora endophytica]